MTKWVKRTYIKTDEHRRKLGISNLGKFVSEETREKIRKANLGKKHSEETRKKMSDAQKRRSEKKGGAIYYKNMPDCLVCGKKLTAKKSKYCCKHKGTEIPMERRLKISRANRGSKSYLWKGGVTPLNSKIRHSMEYKLWRESVFKRDDWTCVFCKVRGDTLNADHIKPFAYFPELRFDINNGRTLCVPCHKKTDTYGYKIRREHYENNK